MPTIKTVEWPEEFLIRCRPPSMKEDPSWHVSIGSEWTDPSGDIQRQVTQPLTPEKAIARGWTPDRIVKAINIDLMQHNDRLIARVQEREAKISALEHESKAKDGVISGLRAHVEGVIAERNAARAIIAAKTPDKAEK